MLKKITLLFFAYFQASIALSDAPLIWGPNNSAKLLNSGELLGKNGDIYLHSPVALIFPAANAKGPLLNDGSGTLSWLVGNNNSIVGFDSTGTMISIPGYSWDQVTNALNANLTVDPFVSSYTLYGFNTQANPTADTVNAVTNVQFQNDCGTDDSGFACGNPATGSGGLYGINNNLNSNHKSPAGHLQQYSGFSQIGNGVDPITVHDIGGIANGQTLVSGVTLNYVNQIVNNLQAPAGSKLSTYTGLSDYSNINHLLQNYNGIQNSATIATIDGYYSGFQDTAQVTTENANYTSVQVTPGIATMRGSYNGVNIAPNVVNAALTAEVFEITTVADVAQSLAGKYVTFCLPFADSGTCWAAWFEVSGAGVAPVAPGFTLVQVNIATNDTAATVGTALYTAVNALSANLTFVDSGTGIVTGTATVAGGSQQASAQDSGFAVVMTTFGGGDGQAYGININMANATGFIAGSTKAINATGDVGIDGKLQTSVTAPMTDQGGASANPVNTINTGFTIAPGVTVNNADEFGFGPIANLTLGANAHLNASPGLQVGASSLGMIGLITMDNGSTATNVNGSFIAQVLVGGTGAGGVIDDMNSYRAVSANFGSPSTVTNYRAYFADDLLGAPATNSWGLYSKASFENYMGKSLKIGGAPVTGDKVANSSVGLQVTDTAVYPEPITTAARNALTPLEGMLINNSDTAQLERYDGAAWTAVGGFIGTTGSVPFVGAGGTLTEDNANFNWNVSNPAGGSLGIGTVADNFVKLHVKTGDAGADIRQLLDSPSSHILFLSGNSAGAHGGGTPGNPLFDFSSTRDLHFTSSSDTGLTGLSSKMMIRGDNGNVGIGTTNPSSLLTVAGNIALTSSGTSIASAATHLDITQTGDAFGASTLSVQNRGGSAGAIISNAGLDLVDMGFLPNAGPQAVERLEHRAAGLVNAGNTLGEFQFISDSLVSSVTSFVTGTNATIVNTGNLGIGTTAPATKFDVLGKFQVDTNGNVLKINNVATSFPAAQGAASTYLKNDGSGGLTWAATSVNVNATTTYSASVGDKIMTDSSGGAFTITLPAAPSFGDEIEVFDATNSWATNNVTLNRNGEKIDGATANFILNMDGGSARLKYYDPTNGWRVYL